MRRSLPIAGLLFAAPLLGQSPSPSDAPAWPPKSDIPAESRIHFGAFENGMRWAWMDNPEPKKRSYIRLHVNAGSLSEEASELGMAHFLEHMCFNGTKHHPGETLVEWFQKNGMDFGADTNAFTSYSQTVYMLDLPTSDEATLREGLTVLRDFSDGVLLAPEEITSEKGVVDAEDRESDSPGSRAQREAIRLQFSGTRVPERDPIGTKTVRDAFTSESVRAFHSKWYRPENLTLVLVGDLQGADPTALFEKAFADMAKPASPVAREPASGSPDLAHPFYAVYEKDLPTVGITIQRAAPWKDRPQTRAWIAGEMPIQIARTMLNLRFNELRKKAGAPFLSIYTTDPHSQMNSAGIRVQDGPMLSISCTPDTWKDALAAGEQELRRAIEHGFEVRELEEVRTSSNRQIDEAVAREKTRNGTAWVSEILSAAENGSVPSSAAFESSIMKPALAALDVAACQKALKEAWDSGTLIIGMTGPVDLGPDGPKLLEELFAKSRTIPVEARKSAELAPFAYASNPETKGEVATREHVEDLDVHVVTFENGVCVLIKPTDFEKKQILVSVPFARGELDLAPSQSAMGFVAQQIVDACGLEAHSTDDLRKLLAGQQVSVSFSIDDDQFELNGATTREDLVREFELMCAGLMHAGWREEGPRLLAQRIPVFYENLKHQHGGPISLEFMPEMYSGDRSKGIPTRAAVDAVKLEQVRAWLDPLGKTAPVDVVVVGDLDVEETVAAAARTFGVLPKRAARTSAESEPARQAKLVTGLRKSYEIDSKDDKALVWILFPTCDGRDMEQRRRLQFLADVVGDRLRVAVREKLSATYAPAAFASASDTVKDDGFLAIQVMADPKHVEPLVDAVLSVANALAESGPTQEEVDRLRGPALNQLRDAQRTNPHWRNLLGRLHAHANAYEQIRTAQTWLESVKAEDLAPLAKTYLKKESADIAIVLPKAKAVGKPSESSAPKRDE